ncbi:hypothetical protein B484DRAFT_471193 [Ochromonadaceae sp. CCMP2298]|nr:hypothetical protein B484DRAFT_471193 [Ochromonadaceae sp. CCMP2298]
MTGGFVGRSVYPVLQAHLNSEVRLHELCGVEDCPPLLVSMHAIGRALRRTWATMWAATHKVGRLKEFDPAQKERRRMWLRVFHAEMCIARKKEEAGKVVVVQMDESFCNQLHFCEKGVVEIDEEGQVRGELHRHKGKGPRLCLAAGVTQWGPMVCRGADGEFVRDHRWQNAKGEKVNYGGTFVELENMGNPRAGYERRRASALPKCLKDMLLPELRAHAEFLGAYLNDPHAQLKTKADIIEYLVMVCGDATEPRHNLAPAAATGAVPQAGEGEEFSAEQVILEDFTALRESLRDQARTTIKVFQANCPKGGYHKNFDTVTFFKWFCALVDTYPEWAKQMQLRLEAGELPDVPLSKPFFDWERGQPARALVLSLDNAPYHKGIAVQLSSKTKGECAAILRTKGVGIIEFTATNEIGAQVRANAEVPPLGAIWESGWPNAAQEPGLGMLWNAEYVSTEIYIEMFWGSGKNDVGNPRIQYEGRSLADVSDILHNTWFKNPDGLCRHSTPTLPRVLGSCLERPPRRE